MAPYLEKEIRALDYFPNRVFKTGVELTGDMSDCIRLNLHLFCAGQVLFLLRSFQVRNADELYRAVFELPWEKILPLEDFFSVTCNVRNETITNELFVNMRVKDAIADRFRKQTGSRPDSGAGYHGAVVHVYWQEDHADIYLDTSGETLSKHGYRKIPGKAPMMESLASAVILAGKWEKDRSFVNPMCGSGTLAIEAALMATNRAPGLFRKNYAFMHLKDYDDSVYRYAYKQMEKKIVERKEISIIASDIRKDAVDISKINAELAGVAGMIHFEECDFYDTTVPQQNKGAIYFNPEYGDRLGVEIELQETYARMGDFLKKKAAGYWGYIFTGNLELAKKIGLKATRRIEFFNGKIDCRLLEYEMYEGKKVE
jgi:putative N6-adenine-specific DNA methylase